jgi:hypothetical protein
MEREQLGKSRARPLLSSYRGSLEESHTQDAKWH